MNAYQPDPSHDGPPPELTYEWPAWPWGPFTTAGRWEAQERMSEFVAGARISRILQRIEPREQIAQTAYQVATDPNRPYEREEEIELCAVCNLWWSTHAENDWCAPTPASLPGARCDYPGCLGPADGSECRHPRPEDEPDVCTMCGRPLDAKHLEVD